jgi:hypothetical protein
VITLISVSLILFLATNIADAKVPANEQAWQYKYTKWMPPVWQRLAQCESGHNPPNWKHDSGTYSGGFGFYFGSWTRFRYAGYPSRASLATPWQQYRVALRIHARYGFSGWGCYQGSQHAWVRGT